MKFSSKEFKALLTKSSNFSSLLYTKSWSYLNSLSLTVFAAISPSYFCLVSSWFWLVPLIYASINETLVLTSLFVLPIRLSISSCIASCICIVRVLTASSCFCNLNTRSFYFIWNSKSYKSPSTKFLIILLIVLLKQVGILCHKSGSSLSNGCAF